MPVVVVVAIAVIICMPAAIRKVRIAAGEKTRITMLEMDSISLHRAGLMKKIRDLHSEG